MQTMRAQETSPQSSSNRKVRSAFDERLFENESNQGMPKSPTGRHPSLSKRKQQSPSNETLRRSSHERLLSSSNERLRSSSNERLRSVSNKERLRAQQEKLQNQQEKLRFQQELNRRGSSHERLNRSLKSRGAASTSDISVSSSESSDETSFVSQSQPVCIPKSPGKERKTARSLSAGVDEPVKNASPQSVVQNPNINCSDTSKWHAAINNHDWDVIEQMLQSYDHKLYRKPGSPQKSKKPQRKLRVLKYLPTNGSKEDKKGDLVSPLLEVDSKGRTALHFACKEHMPLKLLQRLLFFEQHAATVTDSDGRLPLHIAIIGNLNKQVLDRLIRANPAGLAVPDALKRTPMAYAILRAEHRRDKTVVVTWRHPTSKRQAEWQAHQEESWDNVKFLLETLVTRRKPLSKTHERLLLLESVECLAPPSVLDPMLSVSAKILQEDEGKALHFFQLLFRFNYPVPIFQKALKICGATVSDLVLVGAIRRGMVEHYEGGCAGIHRENIDRELSYPSELLHSCRKKQLGGESLIISKECQEWWDQLRFFLGYSSYNLNNAHELCDDYVLHYAMTIPETPSSLVELLVRLFPFARYEIDPATGALPIHLACKYWDCSGTSKSDNKATTQVLNLLLAGDFTLAWKRYKRRLPLHLAILGGKSSAFLHALLALDVKTANVRDPFTRLFPFQLAVLESSMLAKSLDTSYDSTKSRGEDTRQLDTIYELLRANPIAVCPMMAYGSGDPKGDVGLVAQHVLNWCYTYKKGKFESEWVLNQVKTKVLRDAISKGYIPEVLKKFWIKLKNLIWTFYDERNAGRRIACMPRNGEYLLHAALSNGGTPPIAIELLLELYPASVQMKIPGTDRYPIHIAAGSPSYMPLPFESVISMSSALEMIVLVHPEGLHLESSGRSVLHIAIDSGKIWQELDPVLEQDPKSLSVPDVCSGLFPFQQIASSETFVPTHRLIRSKTSTVKWNERSPEENGRMMRELQRDYGREKLSAIFDMLRAKPEALEGSPCSAKDSLNMCSRNILKATISSGVEMMVDGTCLV
jgi:hypothetical protein